jgi:arsenite/tail-anchored protein-transporting ATPase
MPASGHTLGLTGLPERLLQLLPTGAIADSMREGQAIVHDATRSGAVIVTLPEVLPVTETLELAQGFAETRVPVAAILCNRVLRDPFSADERAVLERFQNEPIYGMERFNSIPQVAESLERLRAEVKAPVIEIEEIPLTGRALVDAAATVLAEIA